MKAMETGKKEKMNISLSHPVASALRKYALESTGHMRGVSDVAEKAIREFLERNNVKIEGQA